MVAVAAVAVVALLLVLLLLPHPPRGCPGFRFHVRVEASWLAPTERLGGRHRGTTPPPTEGAPPDTETKQKR